ncbi:MAG: DEAD/DEAH box helicase, partial [Rhodospirillales bacterium]|nr:DEAD/DEAH box helicase [Rhodospirillales bacterium]
MELYGYQQSLKDDLDAAWHRGARHPLVQLATGGGKTVFAAKLIEAATRAGRRVGTVMHRNELIDQWHDALTQTGINMRDIGALVSGRHVLPSLPAHLISVQTLSRRLEDPGIDEPDLLITDEAHHSAARGYQDIYRMWPNATRLGLTATPARLDGQGLYPTYDTLVEGPTVADLIAWGKTHDRGGLSDYRILQIPVQDRDIPVSKGDFRPGASEAVASKPRVMARVATVWRKHAQDRRTLVFAVSRRHGRLLSASLSQAGARAAFLDGTAIGAERRTTLDAFREGHVNTLVTVDLLIEGFDVPAANCAILARPTKSVVIHLQQCGRVLRRSPDGLDALILDCVGNTSELGGPASPRGWTLFGGAQNTRVEGDRRTAFDQGWAWAPPQEVT